MPRRKTYIIPARETAIFDTIVSELLQHPDAADFDMETIEISVKKKYTPQIRDIDRAINNLTRYLTNNPNSIEMVNGDALVSKKQIAKMLKISRPTLDKWINDGFITPIRSKFLHGTLIFPPDLVLQQLQNQKNKK